MQNMTPRTFEQWVETRTEEERELIHEALHMAYKSRSYVAVWRVLKDLPENPWHGGKEAMAGYAKRKFGA